MAYLGDVEAIFNYHVDDLFDELLACSFSGGSGFGALGSGFNRCK